MQDDFEIVSKRYVPIWREGKRKKQRYIAEVAMALASTIGLVLLWFHWKDEEYLNAAISVQLFEGDKIAISIFVFMGIVLFVMAGRLWRSQRKGSALLMMVEVVALLCLAFTDPFSIDHLIVFAAVALASASWLIVQAHDLEDPILTLAGAAGLISIFVTFSSIGIGERALITSALIGMNLMFFRHFD